MRARLRRLAFARRVVGYCLIALVVAALALGAALIPYRLLVPAVDIPARRDGELRLHFLDVGQGDCTVVEFPDGDVLVVDAGDGAFEHDNDIIRYLRGLAPQSLTLVVTHADADHYGGMAEILQTFRADTVYLPQIGSETDAYRRLLDAVDREDCTQDTLVRYRSIVNGSGAYLVCISPHAAGETDGNEASAVLYLEYEGVRVLLSSDISAAREASLLAEYALSDTVFDSGSLAVSLDGIDILKVAHHGSADATGDDWLACLRPETAVISCGKGNTYGHPAAATVDRLFRAGSDIYRTDELGTIVVSIFENSYSVLTSA